MADLFFLPFRPAFDSNMKVIPGAQAYFTLTETNTEANIYADETLTTPLSNPVVANSVGRWPTIWLDETVTYRLRIFDADADVLTDTPLEEYDPYTGAIDSGAIEGLSVVTPFDFGAVGANIVSSPAASVTDQATLDASTDDGPALQAFFDDMRLPENAHKVYDMSVAHWATAQPLFLVLPLVNTGQLNVEYHGRRLIMGTIHVLPVAQQPGGVPMDSVLTISGPYSDMQGHLMIHAGDRGTSNYVDRRFKIGVRFIQCAESRLEKLTVMSAKHRPYWIDSQFETWDEGDIGAPYPTGSTSKNSIGFQIGHGYFVNCGSCNQFNTDTAESGRSLALSVSAQAQGGDPGYTGTFDATAATYNSSPDQRSRLTVSSTTDILKDDFGKRRVEIPAATFTTIAADNTASTLTWTAGDPVAAGLAVGMQIHLGDGSSVGSNDGTTFEVLSFSGTSNRTIKVYPKPTTEAAKAYTYVYSEWSLHRVMTVLSGTQFLVYPWCADTVNSKWYHISGFGAVSGNDAANVQFGFHGSIWCGGGLNSYGLYGVVCQNFLTDHCDIGVAVGSTPGGAGIGTTLLHTHIEGSTWTGVQIALTTNFSITGGSVFDPSSLISLPARATTASPLPASTRLVSTAIEFQGSRYETGLDEWGIDKNGAIIVSNVPTARKRSSKAESLTVTVDYTSYPARFGQAWAEILWSGGASPAPSGTATFALSTAMSQNGWTLDGATSVTAPTGPVFFRLNYDAKLKVVTVSLVTLATSASGSSGPWTSYTGVAFTDRGDGELGVTKTTSDVWQGQAWFAAEGDYRVRVQPLQSNTYMLLGFDNAAGVVGDNGAPNAFIYFLNSAQWQPYQTNYVADTASSAVSFAANDYLWIERRGTVGRIYTGGPNFEDAALSWTFSMDVSGFDFMRLMIRDASSAMRVKVFSIPPEPKVVSKSATYTETVTSGERIVLATGTWTLNLPPAAGNHAKITVKALGGGTITLDGNASETVDGSATLAVTTKATIVSDGTNWQTI